MGEGEPTKVRGWGHPDTYQGMLRRDFLAPNGDVRTKPGVPHGCSCNGCVTVINFFNPSEKQCTACSKGECQHPKKRNGKRK